MRRCNIALPELLPGEPVRHCLRRPLHAGVLRPDSFHDRIPSRRRGGLQAVLEGQPQLRSPDGEHSLSCRGCVEQPWDRNGTAVGWWIAFTAGRRSALPVSVGLLVRLGRTGLVVDDATVKTKAVKRSFSCCADRLLRINSPVASPFAYMLRAARYPAEFRQRIATYTKLRRILHAGVYAGN